MICLAQFVSARRRLRSMLLMLALFGALSGSAALAQPVPSQHILLLYAYGYGGRGVELFSDGFFKAITEAGFPVTNVYSEYLDLQRSGELPDYRRKMLDMLHKKYARRRIDLIVTVQQPALDFLLTEGKDIAPQAPVITIQHRPLLEAEKMGRRIVGEVNRFDIKGTLERALELFPQTRRVVFASGSSAADGKVAEEAARVAGSFRGRLEFEYTTGMALDEILQRASHLPPHSIIIFTQYNRDTKGRVALAYEVENMIVKVANAPVFGFYDYNLKNGGIGGSVIPVEASGARTGRLAIDILKGAALASAGTLRMNENIPMFDWQQIRRWGGDVGRLPANTVFINRPPSAWQQYGGAIIGTLSFILVQSVLIVVLLVNIRRRKRAESVLSKSEADFHAIFNGIDDAIVLTDLGRRIRLVNPAFLRIFGYRADEVIGRTTELFYADSADYAEQGRRRFHGKPGGEIGVYELRYRHKDGSVFWAESSGARIVDPSGTVLGMIGVHRDITERKRAQKEQAKLQKQFLQAQKMESVGRLAGGVAHDFNNMLAVILGYTEIAMDEVDPSNPIHAHLKEIGKAAKRSADLTRQLLAFARKQTIAPEVLDLNDTVEGMLKMLQRLIGEDIQLAWLPGANLWPIKIDPSQVDQMLANLCVNARDAIAGVGKITIETGNVLFDEAYCADHVGVVPGSYVLLAVSDNGCGMDKEILGKLFEPFFTTKEMGKGTGLGLATIYGIVKQNKGFINVYSEPHQGTTFRIYLLRHAGKEDEQARTEEKPQEQIMRGGETILVVEDDPEIMNLSKRMLERQGYEVLTAGTPGKALRLAEEHAGDIHLLMTDVIMPEMNGRDLAEKMLSIYPNLICLFTSGYTADVIAHHGVLDKGVLFIQKPFSINDLAIKVREALAQRYIPK